MKFETLWGQRTPTALTRGTLTKNERCDVVVVGTGISGAMVAFHLAEAGADVVIVDKRPLASGSTAMSTALVQYDLDTSLSDLADRYGLADAQSIYLATRDALHDLRQLIDGNAISCNLEERPSLYLGRDASDVPALRREASLRERIGLEATYLDGADLKRRYGFERSGAIRSDVAYQLDPRALSTQLLSLAAVAGARIYDRTPLVPASDQAGAIIRTEGGHTIEADHVVYATGFELPEGMLSLRERCELMSTYAVVTKPIDPSRFWPERAMLWETGTPYFYARTTSDGRIIVGGGDDRNIDPIRRQAALPEKQRQLMTQLETLTGIAGLEVEASWAATFAQTADGLPLIGPPTPDARSSFTLGFGGNGIVFSIIGAQIIRDTLAGRTHPQARLFSFGRASALRARAI